MAENSGISLQLSVADEFIDRFNRTLRKIDQSLPMLLDFKWQFQKENLMSLVKETEDRLVNYEHIYPYIKELCNGQTINPAWYSSIEKVLNWALKKGRGKSKVLSREIKNAWIVYVVLLSCSMIDTEEKKEIIKANRFILKTEKGKFINLQGNN